LGTYGGSGDILGRGRKAEVLRLVLERGGTVRSIKVWVSGLGVVVVGVGGEEEGERRRGSGTK